MLSVVVPLLNESENVVTLYQALVPELQKVFPDSWELIFVDDGSSDDTFLLVGQLSASDPKVRGIALSRNFGHQMALYAGLEAARGELVVTMDGDLQHPPRVIASLVARQQEGFDVVNTRRLDAAGTPLLKQWTSRGFYRLLRMLADVEVEPSSSDFRLMSRRALNAYLQFSERSRYHRGLISWMGFSQSRVDFRAGTRCAAKTKFTWRKMTSLALDGITAFSGKPLRLISQAGVLVFLFGLFYGLYAVVRFFGGQTVSGWASLLISVWLIGGLVLLSLGLIGEYLLRIFNESKQRPPFIVRERTWK